MSALNPSDFADFFRAVYDGRDPFPWQQRVAERVCGGSWCECIALPTAAGKTACIDIALFALACQADRPAERRTAPRRIFFVVDRRVVVDQAFEHANRLAKRLSAAKDGVLGQVAAALKNVAGCECNGNCGCRPLDVYALRGGMYHESAWVRSPLQPTVITSTVDQVGSRLLFRGYGVSDPSKPLHAALVGNDVLILLDEAHCARPFEQTMTLVRKYRSWADEPLQLPFHFVTMTATPPGEMPEDQIERLKEEDAKHPELGKRIRASKPAYLTVAERASGMRWRDGLVNELVKQAQALRAEGFRAVGVIVNRVATARQAAAELRNQSAHTSDVVLLTGRMRPMDRDATLKKIEPLISDSPTGLKKPVFVVATQCIEVGADLDFHALVTECASLDALRQRFGRLNRIAAREKARAVIVVRADQTRPVDEDAKADPVYLNSLPHTWKWMNDHKDGTDDEGKPWIDFGIQAIHKKLDAAGGRQDLNAPAPDAAVLLPAHLDAWCQTSPKPMPDPGPAYFLHGPRRGEPEVQVVFRNDLGEDSELWAEIVSLCPPSSPEALSMRLHEFRRWLAGQEIDESSSDVEGEQHESSNGGDQQGAGSESTSARALRWRGPEARQTIVINSVGVVTPGDVYVVPISTEEQRRVALRLGDFPGGEGGTGAATDLGDAAFQRSRDRAILRLRHGLYSMLDATFDTLDPNRMEVDEIQAEVERALAVLRAHQDESVRRAAGDLAVKSRRTVKRHPLGGLLLVGKRRLGQFAPTFVEPEESWESTSDCPYPLDEHGRDVAKHGSRFAQQAGLSQYAEAVELAGRLHDIGKADPRFQAWLHGGNRRRAGLYPHPLAKSVVPMPTPRDRAEARKRAGYPEGGRHELLSLRLAQNDGVLPANPDLILHLIASHHGLCRPFSPVVDDAQPVNVELMFNGQVLRASSATGLEHLDSGVPERFWRLIRRFGWWGLPLLEALLRLADWTASERSESGELAISGALSDSCATGVRSAPPSGAAP